MIFMLEKVRRRETQPRRERHIPSKINLLAKLMLFSDNYFAGSSTYQILVFYCIVTVPKR